MGMMRRHPGGGDHVHDHQEELMSSPDMTGTGASRSSHSAEYPEGHYDFSPRGWASAVSIIAGMLLGMVAAFEILQGVAAIAKDDMFVSGVDYVYQLNTATWGWTHVVLGILLTAVAIGMLAQKTWGRVTGLIVAGLSTVANFAFLPYYPVWSLTIVAVNIVIICALGTLLGQRNQAQ
jgi:hypothetical protein